MFTGFWICDSELGTEENEEEGVTGDGVGNGDEEEGSEFLKRWFHWLNR
jgi:hypothetical protein